MEIKQTKVRDKVIFKVCGRIDSSTANIFEQTVEQALRNGIVNFIIDCTDLEFISSAGLRALLNLTKNIKPKNGAVSLCNLSQQTKAVLDIAGILAFLKTYDTLEEALASD